MAASTTETPVKKLKKRASAADLAPTPAPTPDGVTETAKKRKKKHADAGLNGDHADATPVKTHRKEKKVEKGQAVQDLELVVTPVDDATSKKEKKKGKSKFCNMSLNSSRIAYESLKTLVPSEKQHTSRIVSSISSTHSSKNNPQIPSSSGSSSH